MENNNLIRIIKTFNKKEIKEFDLFINSPFFNKNKNVVKLFGILKKQYPAFNPQKIIKKELYKKIFSVHGYDDENMKTIIYLLTRLAEKYIAYSKYQANWYEERKQLLVSLNERKLDKLFIKYEKQTDDFFNNINGVDVETLYERIDFTKTRCNFYVDRNEEEKIYKHDLKSGEYAMALFFIELFRHFNSLFRIKKLNFKLGFDFASEFMNNIDMENLIKSFKKYEFENLPIIEIYYRMYKSLSEGNHEYYQNFKKTFTENLSFLGNSEKYSLAELLANCAHDLHLRDPKNYTKEYFEAKKISLAFQNYSGEVYLRTIHFTVILRLGVQLKEFEWVEQFISENLEKLHPEHRENMQNYSMAYLFFAKRSFSKTLEFILKVNFDTFQLKYHLRNLQLMTFYELSDFESAISLIDSFKHFIKEDRKYGEELKKGYLEFANYTNEIMRIKLGIIPNNTKLLREKIEKSNSMRKQWLLEKIDELVQ